MDFLLLLQTNSMLAMIIESRFLEHLKFKATLAVALRDCILFTQTWKGSYPEIQQLTYVMHCAVWYHLYDLKNVKNTHKRVLLLAKRLQLY